MSDRSAIEWTDATWNPIRARNLKTGRIGWHCEHATTGCEFCYAETMNKRLGTSFPFKPGHRADIEIFLDDEMLTAPLKWKRQRKIFVGSMTDLFADFVKDEWIEKIFDTMLQTDHTFQVLTKRPARMRQWVTRFLAPALLPRILENIWLGVSCERQEEADERIPLLLQTPAVVRFISAEPLLGPIDLIGTFARYQDTPGKRCAVPLGRQLIDWVIVGGESGANARPMRPDWARLLRDQCAAAGVAFFFKQWGEFSYPNQTEKYGAALRVGKKAAGRILDGRTHDEFPAVYNAQDDFAKSRDVGFAAIRERMAGGGPGWDPK